MHPIAEALLAADGGQIIETEDGFLIDAETGEVLGQREVKEAFVIDTPEKANWALQKMSVEEAEILAIDARIRALTENLTAMRKEHERRLEWLHVRFDNELAELARKTLAAAGGKSKTCRFDYGSVSFRQSTGTNRITDMDAAVAWAKEHCPQIVQVKESVLVSDVMNFDLNEKPFVESSGPKESISIKTGVM